MDIKDESMEDNLEKLARLLKFAKSTEDRLFLLECFLLDKRKSKCSQHIKRPKLTVIQGGKALSSK